MCWFDVGAWPLLLLLLYPVYKFVTTPPKPKAPPSRFYSDEPRPVNAVYDADGYDEKGYDRHGLHKYDPDSEWMKTHRELFEAVTGTDIEKRRFMIKYHILEYKRTERRMKKYLEKHAV